MLTGKIVEEFKIGKDLVKIRYPKFEDYKAIQKLTNSLVNEGAYLNISRKVNKKEELDFITDLLKNVENKKSVAFVVEINGKVKGIANIDKYEDTQDHVGNFEIRMGKEIRGKGIGKRLMNNAIEVAKKNLKIEILELCVFSENKIAQNLYNKFGFKKIGIIKKRIKKKKKYLDDILMVKYL